MQQLSIWLSELGPWSWLIFAAALFVLETIVPGVFLMWFGFAAALIGLVLFFVPLDWQIQLLIFAVLSVVSVLLARMVGNGGSPQSGDPHLNDRGAQLVGQVVVVSQAIRDGRGRVQVGDSMWLAQGPDADAGARVRITGVHGTALTVEPVS